MSLRYSNRNNVIDVEAFGGCALLGCGVVALVILLVLAALVKFVFFT